MNPNETIGATHTKTVPIVHTQFLPETNILDDKALRGDYEKLRITYELLRDIGYDVDIDSVLNRILDRMYEFLKYDRGIVLLVDRKGKLKRRAYRNIKDGDRYFLSKTLIRHVVNKKEGIISSDIRTDDRFNTADSILFSGVRSSMAVPILYQNQILGVIMVESSQRTGAFTEKDLHLIMNIANHTAQFIKNSLLHEELQVSFNSAVRTLSATVDARHPLTGGHSDRVTKFSMLIAKELDLSRSQLATLSYAALLHDIGKIGISDKVLLKNGPFEPSEREEMKTHAEKTKEILEKFHFPEKLKSVPQVASLHHEKLDGNGYPNGFKGSELPVEAKIITVADVFDALTSHREYPKYDETGENLSFQKMPITNAVDIIEKKTGTQFDPEVVGAFKKCLPFALNYFRGSHFAPADVDAYIASQTSTQKSTSIEQTPSLLEQHA